MELHWNLIGKIKRVFENRATHETFDSSNCSPGEAVMFPFLGILQEEVPQKHMQKLGMSINWKAPNWRDHDVLSLYNRTLEQEAVVTRHDENLFDVSINGQTLKEGLSTLETANTLISFASDVYAMSAKPSDSLTPPVYAA